MSYCCAQHEHLERPQFIFIIQPAQHKHFLNAIFIFLFLKVCAPFSCVTTIVNGGLKKRRGIFLLIVQQQQRAICQVSPLWTPNSPNITIFLLNAQAQMRAIYETHFLSKRKTCFSKIFRIFRKFPNAQRDVPTRPLCKQGGKINIFQSFIYFFFLLLLFHGGFTRSIYHQSREREKKTPFSFSRWTCRNSQAGRGIGEPDTERKKM